MGKSIKKNYIYNLLYQVLVLLTPLITTPYLSRVLGADGIGSVSFAESISSYFMMFAMLGIANYGQREVSYVRDSLEDRSRVFWELQILKTFTTVVMLTIYFIFIFCFVQGTQKILLTVLALQVLSVGFEVVWFFQAMEEFGKIVLRNAIIKILTIIFIFIAVKSKEDLIFCVIGTASISVLSAISIWSFLPKYIQKISLKSLRPFKHLKGAFTYLLPAIAIQIYTVFDKTMIGIITKDVFQNGYYEQATRISKMLLVVVTSVVTVIAPRIGYYFERKEKNKMDELMYNSFRFVWCSAIPISLGLSLVSSNFVPWFFGDGFDGVVPILQVLSFLIIPIGLSEVIGIQYLNMTKRQNFVTLSVTIGAVFNFILNLTLIPIIGALGAAIASLTAEFLIAMIQFYIVRKELKFGIVLKSGINYIVAGGLMAILLYYLDSILVSSILNTFIMVISGALAYFIVLFILRDKYLIDNVKKFLNKILRKPR